MTKKQIKNKIVEQLKQTMVEYTINPDKWELKELTLADDMGHGYALFTHKEDLKNHMTEQRRMEFQGFFFDEKTGEMIQGNYPVLN